MALGAANSYNFVSAGRFWRRPSTDLQGAVITRMISGERAGRGTFIRDARSALVQQLDTASALRVPQRKPCTTDIIIWRWCLGVVATRRDIDDIGAAATAAMVVGLM